MIRFVALLGIGLLTAANALAETVPTAKQTQLGLYLTAARTPGFLAETPSAVFIDVRTPEEIDDSGLADGIDALIPWALNDAGGNRVSNAEFLPGLAKFLDDESLGKDAPIVLICRSGNRTAQAVDRLAALGYTQVYTVTDGYLGDRAKTGPTAGQRTVNGWKNAGLAWHQLPASRCAPTLEGGHCN